MNYLILRNIAILFGFAMSAFASQVQSSDLSFKDLNTLHLDECIVRHFGETTSESDLVSTVMDAPLAVVVDAFIECPNQMSCIYYENEKEANLDKFIHYVRENGMFDPFYSALRTIQSTEHFSRNDAGRLKIYSASFFNDIPYDFYLEDLMHDHHIHGYCHALLHKAMACKTSESKNWIIGLMNEALTRLPKSSDFEIILKNKYTNFNVRVAIKLMTEEVVDLRAVNPNYQLAVVFFGLSFNRYEVAETVVEKYYCRPYRMDLEDAIEIIGNRRIAHIKDVPRAVGILKKLLRTENDKESFDNFVKENHII